MKSILAARLARSLALILAGALSLSVPAAANRDAVPASVVATAQTETAVATATTGPAATDPKPGAPGTPARAKQTPQASESTWVETLQQDLRPIGIERVALLCGLVVLAAGFAELAVVIVVSSALAAAMKYGLSYWSAELFPWTFLVGAVCVSAALVSIPFFVRLVRHAPVGAVAIPTLIGGPLFWWSLYFHETPVWLAATDGFVASMVLPRILGRGMQLFTRICELAIRSNPSVLIAAMKANPKTFLDEIARNPHLLSAALRAPNVVAAVRDNPELRRALANDVNVAKAILSDPAIVIAAMSKDPELRRVLATELDVAKAVLREPSVVAAAIKQNPELRATLSVDSRVVDAIVRDPSLVLTPIRLSAAVREALASDARIAAEIARVQRMDVVLKTDALDREFHLKTSSLAPESRAGSSVVGSPPKGVWRFDR